MNNKDQTNTTLTKRENSLFDFKQEVLETAICECGKEYNSHTRIFIFGEWKEGKSKCCRDCDDKEQERKMIEKENKERIERFLNRFDKDSLINPKLQKATFEDYQPTSEQLEKAKKVCMRYANNFDLNNPVSLLLIGNYGTGKSHLAASIAKFIIENKIKTCLFISTPKLLTKLRSTYNRNSNVNEDDIIKELSNVSLLVLDDLGSEQAKPTNDQNEQSWATSKIFEIIDNRIGKHTIFTSNFTVEELQERIGGRNFSRMMENTHVVKMYGDDYRLRNFK